MEPPSVLDNDNDGEDNGTTLQREIQRLEETRQEMSRQNQTKARQGVNKGQTTAKQGHVKKGGRTQLTI
jgi:hypothetical protein